MLQNIDFIFKRQSTKLLAVDQEFVKLFSFKIDPKFSLF